MILSELQNFSSQVIGLAPYENSCYQDTNTLCDQIMNSMIPRGSEIEVDHALYLRNLVLQVCLLCRASALKSNYVFYCSANLLEMVKVSQ